MPSAPSAREDLSGAAVTAPRSAALRWRAAAATAIILVVFAAVVALVSFDLRKRWRAQVLQREAEVLQAVARMQENVVSGLAGELGIGPQYLALEVALHTAQLEGVLAVRLFDHAGEFRGAVPPGLDEGMLLADDLEALRNQQPVVRFHPAFPLAELFLDEDFAYAGVAPMLEVSVPLGAMGTDEPAAAATPAVAQYWIEGERIAAEFAQLDRRVATQAGSAFVAGAVLILGSLMWAFRRLATANRLLRARADDLARANRELAQSARTAAIGAITAHLMHGLRNPLAGLEGFVAAQSSSEPDEAGGELAAARESTRRLRAMINDVQTVLHDVQEGAEFAVTVGELCGSVRQRLQTLATACEVRLLCNGALDAVLGSREAGLGGLVLTNLLQNAIEAAPAGSEVSVTSTLVDDAVALDVADRGPGLSEEVAREPFRPRRSTKPEGAGIGLAISRELARHAGGELTLVRTAPDGTVFRLRLPRARIAVR